MLQRIFAKTLPGTDSKVTHWLLLHRSTIMEGSEKFIFPVWLVVNLLSYWLKNDSGQNGYQKGQKMSLQMISEHVNFHIRYISRGIRCQLPLLTNLIFWPILGFASGQNGCQKGQWCSVRVNFHVYVMSRKELDVGIHVWRTSFPDPFWATLGDKRVKNCLTPYKWCPEHVIFHIYVISCKELDAGI